MRQYMRECFDFIPSFSISPHTTLMLLIYLDIRFSRRCTVEALFRYFTRNEGIRGFGCGARLSLFCRAWPGAVSRKSPRLTREINLIPFSSYMTLFIYFSHGLSVIELCSDRALLENHAYSFPPNRRRAMSQSLLPRLPARRSWR